MTGAFPPRLCVSAILDESERFRNPKITRAGKQQ